MYRQWGGDLISMSVLPEAKLAREAELRYDSTLSQQRQILIPGDPQKRGVTAADVFKTLQANASSSRLVTAHVLEELAKDVNASLFEPVNSVVAHFTAQTGKLKLDVDPH